MAITKTIGELIDALSICNTRIWFAEDIKRKEGATDQELAAATRVTNTANVERNKLIQGIDEALGQESYSKGDSKLYGEKPFSSVAEQVEVAVGFKETDRIDPAYNFIHHIAVKDTKMTSSEYVANLASVHKLDTKVLHLLNRHDDVFLSTETYAAVLVYGLIEKTINPGILVDNIFRLNFKKLYAEVPLLFAYSFSKYKEDGIFSESSFADQFAWYTPYTLFNLFKKHITDTNAKWELLFLDDKSTCAILISYE